MKKIILSAAIFGFTTMAIAQETVKKDVPVNKMGVINKKMKPMETMGQSLNLTEAQKAQIKALKDKPNPYKDEMKKLQERQMELRKLQSQERDAEMKKILTPEQYATYTEQKSKRVNHFKRPDFKGGKTTK